MENEEIKNMIQALDYKGNGKLNYTEFLAATIDKKTFFNDHKLKAVFNMFDVDGNGTIQSRDMYVAF